LALCVGVAGAQDFLINEVDADTDGTDVLEFIELYGPPNTPLDSMVVVLINGSDDLCYADGIDLDGYATDGNGFFRIGCPAVVPTPDIVFESAANNIQNGPDAVALYWGDGEDYYNDAPWTTDDMIDAVVYNNSTTIDWDLLHSILGTGPEAVQINEDANSNKGFDSAQRCFGSNPLDGRAWHTIRATPWGANNCDPLELDADERIEGVRLYSCLATWESSGAVIRYDLPAQMQLTIRVFDTSGRLVRTLLDQQTRGPGQHATAWDLLDESRRPVSTGVYLYRLETDSGAASSRIVFIR
jgi:hypothetical protein